MKKVNKKRSKKTMKVWLQTFSTGQPTILVNKPTKLEIESAGDFGSFFIKADLTYYD